MPIAFLRKNGLPVNQSTRFEFSEPVGDFVAGISYFYLNFRDRKNHHVHEISLGLHAGQPSKRIVEVEPWAIMKDVSGHTAHPYLDVTVAAWLGEDVASSVVFGQAPRTSVELPGIQPDGSTSLFQGMAVKYPEGRDHHVRSLRCSTEATIDSGWNTAELSGTAAMSDDAGNAASNPSVDVGFLAGFRKPGFEIQTCTGKADMTDPYKSCDLEFGAPLKDVAMFIKSFTMNYPEEDHHVYSLGAGGKGFFTDGLSYVYVSRLATMQDYRGHRPYYGHLASCTVTLAIIGKTA